MACCGYTNAVAMQLENPARRRTCAFRTFVHSEESMIRVIESAGFERVAHAHTIAWAAAVFARR